MNADFGILHHLWNHREPGLLDRAAGEIGVDRVVIPIVTGPLAQFRFPDSSSRYFETEGGWHFHPQTENYRNSRLKPHAARWLGARDPLSRFCERAAALSVRVVFRIDLRAAGRLVDHHSLARAKNAWDDETPRAGLCVSNPDVRELLRGTLDDLVRFDPAGFEICNWAVDAPVDQAITGRPTWSLSASRLLDACFCESCRQRAVDAGCDPDMAARAVRVEFDRLFDPASPPSPKSSALAEPDLHDPMISTYARTRRDDTNDWLARLARQHDSRIRMHVLNALCPHAQAVAPHDWTTLIRVPSGESVDPIAAAPTAPASVPAMSIPAWRPSIPDSSTLVRIVSEITSAATRYLDFEGLDESPADALHWLKQALRYARRV